jgi:hypothetical protein
MARTLSIVLAWLVCASLAQAEPAQVIVIRHGEKPPTGPELSMKGRQRAAALVPYFLETPEVLKYKTPVAIYAQKSTEEHPSKRHVDTVRPLAKVLKLDVLAFPREDYVKMVKEIRNKPEYEGRMVLICWQHKSITNLTRELGVKDPPIFPQAFDRTWIIFYEKGKTPTLRDIPQKLLYGDSAK